MSDNKKYYWLKLKEDFFEEDAIAWLEEQENGTKYCLFYLKLCLKSLKSNGTLIRNVGSMLVPYDAKALAKITNTDIDTVILAMELFTKIGLVQKLENGEFFMTQLQDMVGSETSKAKLMRNKRKKDKEMAMISNGGNNVTKELPNKVTNKENCYTEIEIEKDIEKDIELEKEKDIDIKEKEEVNMFVGNLKEFSKLYEQNIGVINGVTAEYLIDLSETIDVALFKRAIEIATDRGSCNLGYIKGIIRQWLNTNITTLEQLEAYKLQQNQNNKNTKGAIKDDTKGRTDVKSAKNVGETENNLPTREELLRQIAELDNK